MTRVRVHSLGPSASAPANDVVSVARYEVSASRPTPGLVRMNSPGPTLTGPSMGEDVTDAGGELPSVGAGALDSDGAGVSDAAVVEGAAGDPEGVVDAEHATTSAAMAIVAKEPATRAPPEARLRRIFEPAQGHEGRPDVRPIARTHG